MSAAAKAYWDAHAGEVSFSHPLEIGWLVDLPKTARLLDYGCGYGRMLGMLADAGWRNAVGVDLSGEMVARGRAARPDLDLRELDGVGLDEPDGAFDGAVLFAVLTSVPDGEEQMEVMAELRRLIRPGGLLYLSDYLLQAGERYAARYRAGLERHGVEGVWTREDGGVFRHQTRAGLDALTAGFDILAEREIETTTLSGASAIAIQRLGRRR